MNIFSLFGLFCPKKFNVYLSAENMLISFNQPKKNRTTYSPANVAISVWNGGGGCRSGGAMVHCKILVPGRPTYFVNCRMLAYCISWLFGHFFPTIVSLLLSPLSGRGPDIDGKTVAKGR